MRLLFALAATSLIISPALAKADVGESTTAAIVAKRGSALRDAKGLRLGTIDRVNDNGSVQIIFNSKFVTIPADKLVASDAGVATSLTKAEVAKLR